MKAYIPASLKGIISIFFWVVNTVPRFFILLIAALLKLLVPFKWWRKALTLLIIWTAENWAKWNGFIYDNLYDIQWNVEGLEQLEREGWYLVISNHQTWIDIPILQKLFYKKIPFLKFFLKKELIWVPIMGICWWALDFPFMKRYSAEYLKKKPHMKGKDIEITRKACEKFKTTPVSVMNYLEGSRFSTEKHDYQKSPYKNLLKPKSGGVGFVLTTMGEQLKSIVDVTIYYPQGRLSMWDFLCGRLEKVDIIIKTIPITDEILGDYIEDQDYRNRFQKWINDLWIEKDQLLDEMAEKYK